MVTVDNLLSALSSERCFAYPSATLQRALLRYVRKIEGLSAKEAVRRYGLWTVREWEAKIRSVENNEKQ